MDDHKLLGTRQVHPSDTEAEQERRGICVLWSDICMMSACNLPSEAMKAKACCACESEK